MKRIIPFLLISIFFANLGFAQSTAADTTVQFKVDGVCGMCQQRIQKALRIKGVTSAKWQAATKLATVTYKPAVVTLQELHRTVAAVGHDTELERAEEKVYRALPDCCLYKDGAHADDEPEDAANHDDHKSEATGADSAAVITGIVVEKTEGKEAPLPGASIQWVGVAGGTTTNSHGEFTLPKLAGATQLVISYTGYRPDTISAGSLRDIQITLNKREGFNTAVVVTARNRSAYVDALSPFRVAVMTKRELLKAACCNLSESFETNPSVDVSFNDAATGSKQIQMLGLAGVYTQLTVENGPGPRGIATMLGLNNIAGPWIESIQIIKGTGSVVNGFESIAGQINVELRQPRNMEKLYLNGYVNNMGKTDLNLNWAKKLNNKWRTALLLHNDFMYSKQDFNKDGFMDLPMGIQFSGVNRWEYLGDNGFMAQFGVKALVDEKTGGELRYDKAKHRGGTEVYGLGINTARYEAFAKLGYVFPEKMYKSIGLQLNAFTHRHDSYFGLNNYDARQRNFYANLIYQTQIGSEKHVIKGGASFLYDQYRETLQQTPYDRNEVVPGVFGEYTFAPNEKLDVVAGLRADHNSLYGFFATPRLNVRYAPFNNTTVRLSVGRGQRTANVFAENLSLLVSSRRFVIQNTTPGGAYGLAAEVAWNKGISIDQRLKIFGRNATIAADFYRNDFQNQVVVDLENAREVRFYNLQGRSYSNSFGAELNASPLARFDVRLAYRLYDVKTTFSGQLLERPFVARHRGFVNLAYETSGWKFDFTQTLTGTKRLPSTAANPPSFRFDDRSPVYTTINAQVSKTLGKKKAFDIYLGGENFTNYFQPNAIISAAQPFGPLFDASLIWGPVTGAMVYTGFRLSIK